MHGRRSWLTGIALFMVLGAIVVSAFAMRAFDDYYYGPICQRYGQETGMEYVSISGGTRRDRLHCTFMLYNDDGSYRAMVDVPLSRIQKWPLNYLTGSLRWLILVVMVVPAVWLARKFGKD